jgi:TonB-linked SusC/RagA family outer membrane protein
MTQMMRRKSDLVRWSALILAWSAVIASTAQAQGTSTISGRVVDQVGTPIVDASITVAQPAVATRSRKDGRFSLTVPDRSSGPVVVTARRLGFRPSSRTITLRAEGVTADFTLESQPAQLSGLTVTALGILAEKSTVGTSQQTVMAEEFTRTQANSVIGALSGKVSGVAINQSGNMGGSTRIVIRGAGSILGQNQPLFILDGIPISNEGFSTASASGGRDYGTALSDLSPDDIASMTILKGPNAAALYGSRAANGAVVITTRSGRNTAEGTHFNFVSRLTIDGPSVLPSYQNRYGQGFSGEFAYVDGAGSGTNDGADESWGPQLDGRLIDQFSGKAQPWVARPDNVSSFFRNGLTASNSINVTAAAKGMGVRLSLTRDNTTGIVPNSTLERTSGTVSGSVAVSAKLDVSGSLLFSNGKGRNRPENGYTEGNPLMGFTWFGRQVDVSQLKRQYYNQNSVYGLEDGSLYNWNDNYHRNPYWQQYLNPASDTRDRLTGQLSATYRPASWLNALVRAGTDGYRFTADERFAPGNIDNADASFAGGFTSATSRARESNIEGILTTQRGFGSLDVTLNAGGNMRRNESYGVNFSTRGLLVPGVFNLSNSAITPTIGNSEMRTAVNSAYGSAVLTLRRLWTVEVTGRNDWSSTLPKENASYFYPSINSSLVVSDLWPAIARGRTLSYLKVRGGVARVGSDAGAYQLQTLYNGSSAKFAGQPLFSLSDVSANPALRPEQTRSAEAGFDAAFAGNRVTIEATYFVKLTRDQIIPLSISPATGFTATTINAGQISNRGVEALATWHVLQSRTGLQWTTSLNFAKVRNRVDALQQGLSTIIIASEWGANIEARQGLPYGTLFGNGYERDSATGQRLIVDGLPVASTSKSVLGNVNPDWFGGWTNQLRAGRWMLSALLDVQHGGENFSIGNWWGTYAGTLSNTLAGREADWDNPGVVAKGIDAATGATNAVRVTAEDYNHAIYPIHEAGIYNSGFAKLREVRLGYDEPPTAARRLRLSAANVALVGRNLATWTRFPNYDPENSAASGNGSKGFDMGILPTLRSFGFNVSLTP